MARTGEPIKRIVTGAGVRYQAVVDAGTKNGKRVQKRKTFDTLKEARTWLAATRTAVEQGRYVAPSGLTVDQAVSDWLKVKESEVRPHTHYGYASALRPLREQLGSMKVHQVRRVHVERVRDELAARGLKKRSTSLLLTLTRQLWTWLIDNGAASVNPAANVTAAGAESDSLKAFTPEALSRIRAHLDGHWLEAGFILTLYGLRRSEVLGLRWSDIRADWTDPDPASATVTVARSRVYSPGSKDYVGATKTLRGARTLPLDRDLLEVLSRLRKEQGATYGLGQVRDGFIVVDELGDPLPPERYSDEWRSMLAGAGVPYLDLRAARRSAVTAMRQRGVPDYVVARFTGHDESIMRKHYSVAMEQDLREAGQVLTGVLRAAR